MAFQSSALLGYNGNSSWQLDINLQNVPKITSHLLDTIALLNPSLLIIADYGSSEGYNSMILFNHVLSRIRQSLSTQVLLFHTDLPANDWPTLYKTINTSEESYKNIPGVYYSCIGQSFYEQLLPSNSVHFGFSTFAFHYLSKVPEKTSNTQMVFPESTAQALEDLAKNLSHRIEELAVGGILFFSSTHRNNDSKYCLEKFIYEPMKKVYERGMISSEEYDRFSWTTYALELRQVKQILDRFSDRIDVKVLENNEFISPYYKKFTEGEDNGEYHEEFNKFMSVLLKNPIRRCTIRRSEEERDEILRFILAEITEIVANDPVYLSTYTVVLQKIK